MSCELQSLIDTSFDLYSDTPAGRDPDSHSPTLRRYHKLLWSKPLPGGPLFKLDDQQTRIYLCHRSEMGEFRLSSDSIGHTYSRLKSMSHIVSQLPKQEIDAFFKLCSTIGGYVLFPSNKIDNRMTINGARGLHRCIADRFDLTLECIRLHYQNEPNPLGDTLKLYDRFFALFQNFRGYVDFFLLADLVSEDYAGVRFFLPFDGFNRHPLPRDVREYAHYMKSVSTFLMSRNERIATAERRCC